ncbi:MAG TPA: dipeptidase [Actinomycetota bacterium]|nr:dipeptidase [Actinomycetota bacterium]
MTSSGERIRDVLRSAPLIDGHDDLLWELRTIRERGQAPPDVSEECPSLQTDLPRLARGRVGGQFWSVYVPSDLEGHEGVTRTLEQIDALHQLVARHPDRLALARTADEVEAIAASGRVASMIGVEGGHAIGCSLGALRALARIGAGYLTLTHNDDTPWADSATGLRPHGGLTRFGEEVVRELNRCGVLVDLSHVSDDVMRQALALSEAPPIFSHSSARAIADVTRNVPDDVLELVARAGAVVMVAFVPSFLTAEGAAANRAAWAEAARVRAEHPDDPRVVRAFMDAWDDAHPDPPATIGDVADHVDHLREIAGIDHIGIGSDFDGAGTMPVGLEDVSHYPALFEELAARGYSDEDLARIAGRNVLRVMREAERVAERLRSERPPSTLRFEDA